jgi:ligand-binding SRPBCC domain-containing protein
MSKVFRLKSIQKLPVELPKTWQFFSDPHNLLTITPPFLNLKVTNDIFSEEVYPGQVMIYTVKPLLGIPFEWMTEITHVEKEKLFVDEQRKGPYKLWHHQHHFKSITGGTEMTDLIHYRLPLGILGSAMNQLVVKEKLEKIFEYRYNKIVELFGKWESEGMNIVIQ